jgi:hypothetical protein
LKTYFVAVSFGYWGRGETEDAALLQHRKAGGVKRGSKIIVYRVDCESAADPPYITDDGTMAWHGERVKVAEIFNGKRNACEAAA